VKVQYINFLKQFSTNSLLELPATTVKPSLKFTWRKNILHLKSRGTLNGGYIKMKQKMTPLVIKTLAKYTIYIM
jgi:hypothetical protein